MRILNFFNKLKDKAKGGKMAKCSLIKEND